MPYRFLEHTADVLVECEAPTFRGLATCAAEALYEVSLDVVLPRSEIHRRVDVAATTPEDLLVRWLQELIFLMEVDRFIATRFAFDSEAELTLGATLTGYLCTPDERTAEVKGATYHEMSVEESESGFRTRILFDL